MKRQFLVIVAAAACILSSCAKSGGGMSDTAKKNLETARAVSKMFESGDLSKTGDYIAADAVDHAGTNGDVVGLDSIKASFTQMQASMSDVKDEVKQEMAKDDYTMQWVKETWTAKTDDMGMKAGDKGNVEAVEVCRFKDGKIVEHWGFISVPDMMKMMRLAGMNKNNGGNNNNNNMGDNTNVPPDSTAQQ